MKPLHIFRFWKISLYDCKWKEKASHENHFYPLYLLKGFWVPHVENRFSHLWGTDGGPALLGSDATQLCSCDPAVTLDPSPHVPRRSFLLCMWIMPAPQGAWWPEIRLCFNSKLCASINFGPLMRLWTLNHFCFCGPQHRDAPNPHGSWLSWPPDGSVLWVGPSGEV